MAQSPCCLLGFELHDEGQNNCQYHGWGLDGRHISYSCQTLRVRGLELVLGLRVLVTLLLLGFQTLESRACITHEIPSLALEVALVILAQGQ